MAEVINFENIIRKSPNTPYARLKPPDDILNHRSFPACELLLPTSKSKDNALERHGRAMKIPLYV